MTQAKKYAETLLLINFPIWLLGLTLFYLFTENFAGEYVLGSVLMASGAMLADHLVTRYKSYIGKRIFFPRGQPFVIITLTAIFTLIGLISQINGYYPVTAFALPASFGSACYQYFYLLKKESKSR
ncbi:hypothetical protein QS306_16425 [Paraburkholderia bonniea]|uniref:hypothetical protein n=1 Tax=Paraburkholderia bonniea TaxID=2152891 RepID=UPI0025732B77|nr:hypothetical protein [Paraburkholderia bonniea]WJF91659.1 hypothetical protein QS306_16425 [Paraburkholderia bonniea]WJF94978.1 hypothetical protein QS308_16430 [Paraburkholderia bonniea]